MLLSRGSVYPNIHCGPLYNAGRVLQIYRNLFKVFESEFSPEYLM